MSKASCALLCYLAFSFRCAEAAVLAPPKLSPMQASARHNNTSKEDVYSAFLHSFGVGQGQAQVAEDGADFHVRRALFEERHAEVQRHNANEKKLWVAAVNRFSDRTESELQTMLGYKPGESRQSRSSSKRPLGAKAHNHMLMRGPFRASDLGASELAAEADWRRLDSSWFLRDQGSCGSCWAVASAGVIELHAEIAKLGNVSMVSSDHLVRCVPNPRHCGGSGGCYGATAELAFEFVKNKGILMAKDFSDKWAQQASCQDVSTDERVTIENYVTLPINRLKPLMSALSTVGPVVGSADASRWWSYSSGVFGGCGRDSIVNHAVVLMGYGYDNTVNQAYWLIRNSWGYAWGEQGYIRLLRHLTEDMYCGIDSNPLEGTACLDDAEREVPVCGMCGVLSDSSYPVGVRKVKQAQQSFLQP